MCIIRKRLRVYGIVQGVGFRPFVDRIAHANGCVGSVCNKGPYVEIQVQAEEKKIKDFIQDLEEKKPERSSILKIEESMLPCKEEEDFLIIQSEKVKGDVFVSPDIAICDTCKKELYDPTNRRYLHPFINCTACGPRLTILDSMPYDRIRTSMKSFPMCGDCQEEYTSPSSRRYHAQPVCCNECGPKLYLVGTEVRGKDALLECRQKIREGGIVAIKGIGGFHLCCDATNQKAVGRLRQLKNRPFKPFAVMVKDLKTAKREVYVSKEIEKLLDGPQKPIVLLKKKQSKIVEEVAIDNPNLGVMLPYAPLHLLLFDYPDGKEMTDCLVMTSANPKGAPICKDDSDVLEHLSYCCDLILSNDRPIRLRADDSVVNIYDGQAYMIRRSRGYAPLPFMTKKKGKYTVLGIGGELKNTFCLANKDLYYPSPYIGDLSDIRTVQALKEALIRMEELLELKPDVVVCDLHPNYQSTALARELGIDLLYCQHHYAHILTGMAEHSIDHKVIGLAFDGTGYGLDGTIWGGEFLICDTHDFIRLGSLEPFWQVGGDLSSKEGWRIAASLLEDGNLCERLKLCTKSEYTLLEQMKNQKINTVQSTSAGRLFDAVSAILGICRINTCEAEASMRLQFYAEAYQGKGLTYPVKVEKKDFFTLPIKDLLQFLATKRLEGVDVDCLAYTFHEVLARWMVEGCLICREKTGLKEVVLSGGVLQNTLLLDLCKKGLEKEDFKVYLCRMSGANDGGIALGQAYYGMENYQGGK